MSGILKQIRAASREASHRATVSRDATILDLAKTMLPKQIADRLGVSISVVGNVLHRHKASGKDLGRAPRVPGISVPKSALLADSPVTLAKGSIRRIGIMRASAAPIDFSIMSPAARAIIEAEPATCRFEVGGDAGFRFCGKRADITAGGRLTYCRTCAPLVYPRMAQAAARGFHGRSDRSFAGA